ncbi:MAG: YbaB/EbfC family nucleoid-associated protein [Phycisphaeraceae bacterium]|nr:YbaB/EbfC family nucleoid-associated protein [Phycisphaeraceae bacterium]
MFDQFKNIAHLMKNAHQIREQAERLKAELKHKSVTGESGAGAVRVTVNGHGAVLRVHLEQPLLVGIAGDDKAMVEELIAAAANDAVARLKKMLGEEVRKATGGMDIPGLEDMLR